MMGEGAWCYYRYKRRAVGKLRTGGCSRDRQQGSADYSSICIREGETFHPQWAGARRTELGAGGFRLQENTLGAAAAKC